MAEFGEWSMVMEIRSLKGKTVADHESGTFAALLQFPISIWFKYVDPVLSTMGTVLSCDWLRLYGDLSNDSISLLDQMGGEMTDEECPVFFPESFYRHIQKAKDEEKLEFIADSLMQIVQLFDGNRTSTGWDLNKTERFLITVDRQARELSSCVRTQKQRAQQTQHPATGQEGNETHRKLAHYYKKLLRSTVHRMGGSAASWELIRRESQLHLERLDLLQARIHRPARPGWPNSPRPHRH